MLSCCAGSRGYSRFFLPSHKLEQRFVAWGRRAASKTMLHSVVTCCTIYTGASPDPSVRAGISFFSHTKNRSPADIPGITSTGYYCLRNNFVNVVCGIVGNQSGVALISFLIPSGVPCTHVFCQARARNHQNCRCDFYFFLFLGTYDSRSLVQSFRTPPKKLQLRTALAFLRMHCAALLSFLANQNSLIWLIFTGYSKRKILYHLDLQSFAVLRAKSPVALQWIVHDTHTNMWRQRSVSL